MTSIRSASATRLKKVEGEAQLAKRNLNIELAPKPMKGVEIDHDALDFMRIMIFGSTADSVEAAYNRAYRDFSRTLRFGDIDTKTRIEMRAKVKAQMNICLDSLKDHYTAAQPDFDQWHERTCYDIRDIYLSRGVPFTFGQAQKWLNMTLKYLFILYNIFKNIIIPINPKNLPKIDTWLDVVGSNTIADDKPICMFIISPAASIACKIQFATKPSKAPAAKFNISE